MSSICLPPVVPPFNQDCLDLHRAFEGLGCDGQAIIRILAHRDAYHRSQVRAVYENMFGEDICKRLKSELHHHFEKAMLMWMRDAPERDAIILRGALKSNKSARRNQIFAETLSTRSMDELDSITEVYNRLYGRSLQSDLEETLTGPTQKLFVLYLHGNQDQTIQLELYFILEEAGKLHSALSTPIDEATFIQVLSTRTHTQLRSIFDAYRTTYRQHIYEALKLKGTTEFHNVLRIITKCVISPEDYFSKVLLALTQVWLLLISVSILQHPLYLACWPTIPRVLKMWDFKACVKLDQGKQFGQRLLVTVKLAKDTFMTFVSMYVSVQVQSLTVDVLCNSFVALPSSFASLCFFNECV